MRLRHIEVFHAIYTTGSVTAAAQLLHISQPAVSKALGHAEQQLGFALFKREKGKLLPTDEALALFPAVEQVYRQLHSVKALAQNIQRHDEGLIDLAITPALGFNVIPVAIARFNQHYPKVRFRLQTIHNDEAMQALVERDCELALLYASPGYPNVEAIELGSTEIKVLYPCETFARQPQSLTYAELSTLPLIAIWDSGPIGQLLWQQLNQAGVDTASIIQVDTYYIAARMVAQGLGCCTIDAISAQGNPDQRVATASLEPPLQVPIRALHLAAKPLSKLSQAFLPFVQSALLDQQS
ncbi:LysR family transcriptional regulator [Pseudidiomarina terrestris]|uniref:LysR family transcriptional regulator n=1 Tax=Pseudidiomarina terrestris TaxID=2820060 RepID=A0AAW7QXX7_9GAMM|nr:MULTISPECIES: LysR family transcriptional regulator [unclassified Pseudidiomarina]MDN7125036.1 LysR family transcriptional regulator [Pseudidiomarina sp. 1APP75-32.1]MDN7129489.1 LysR family transcriptional regulator [Pseudidiomarina sp. 1APR75-15]MDN7135805.1 LysR family transcriptional regulator [Pseudidiomarina sp. 1ASP75-5]MDN7138251.1 LysR family transcriptional regulator [Pseudidiomarina sp. 1ASP75-14]MEA3587965.1 LysR family transcriptional regulator [Pseudidiomarina sp. 1APP75-27a]